MHSLVNAFGAEYEAGNNGPHIEQTQTLAILTYHSSKVNYCSTYKMGDNRERSDHHVKSLLINLCKMSVVEWMTSTA